MENVYIYIYKTNHPKKIDYYNSALNFHYCKTNRITLSTSSNWSPKKWQQKAVQFYSSKSYFQLSTIGDRLNENDAFNVL